MKLLHISLNNIFKKNSKLETLLGFDLRSLALFRISLGIIIITDLINRLPDLEAHYSDSGVFPRSLLLFLQTSDYRTWSIYLNSGEVTFVFIVFVLNILSALLLIIGYRTKWFTICCWILSVSLHNRNPLLLNGGDSELRILLFWSIFLPLGGFYSFDKALNSSKKILPKKLLSGATVALTLQICSIYWFSGLLKSDPVWTTEGSAVYYALNLDHYTTEFGRFLLNFPSLLTVFTFATLWFELLGPFLLFIPWRNYFFRGCAIVLFILLHIGFGLSLRISMFPYISAVGWLVFIPSEFWNTISHRLESSKRRMINIYYDEKNDYSKKIICLLLTFLLIPKTRIITLQSLDNNWIQIRENNFLFVIEYEGRKYPNSQAFSLILNQSPLLYPLHFFQGFILINAIKTSFYKQAYQMLFIERNLLVKATSNLKFSPISVRSYVSENIILTFLLFCIFYENLNELNPSFFEFPRMIRDVNTALQLNQNWGMFAPHPGKKDGWLVVSGKLKDGTEINLLTGEQPISWEKPDPESGAWGKRRWSNYLALLRYKQKNSHLTYYGKYLCSKWNKRHLNTKLLESLKIYHMLEKTLPNYQQSQVKKIFLTEHSCSKEKQ